MSELKPSKALDTALSEAPKGAPQTKDTPQANDTRSLMPRVDVIEDEAGITILADMPGVSKERLSLSIEGDAIVIDGAMAPFAPGALTTVYAEVGPTNYRRSFTLSRELDAEQTEASLKDGVLKLRIPKRAEAKPRRIAVQTG